VSSVSHYRCHALLCFAIIATKRNGIVQAVPPAFIKAARLGKVKVVCHCGKDRWIATG
jgi:hypothetical protein